MKRSGVASAEAISEEGASLAGEAERPLQLTHLGPRYALGSGPDYHGIWDTTIPGDPVQRFPRSDMGCAKRGPSSKHWSPPARRSRQDRSPPQRVGSESAGVGSPARTVRAGNGSAVAALVLGIVSVVLSTIPGVGLILGILTVVLAWLGLRRANEGAPGGSRGRRARARYRRHIDRSPGAGCLQRSGRPDRQPRAAAQRSRKRAEAMIMRLRCRD